jgi:hypothetical protein
VLYEITVGIPNGLCRPSGLGPLGLGAELIQRPDFVGVEEGMDQQPEAAGPEQDQVLRMAREASA